MNKLNVCGKVADWVVGQVRQAVTREQQRMRPVARQGPVIPPAEQMRRFLSGEERYRVEQGLITPGEYAQYEQEMLRRLGALGGTR